MNRGVRFLASILAFAALLPGAHLAAQTPAAAGGWDGARALELIGRAQARRAETHADTGLVSYEADARGYVYFYLDRRDTGQRNLVKTDQLALEVFWRAPDLAKQRIVGWRDEKSLPTNINYHLDHLAVVLENFGDEIRIGDGDEVRDVLHPAAPGAERIYQYRLVDSLTLRLPGAAEPVRVYQLQVRPEDESRPAFVGSVFVERSRGDLVRMDFTFTRAAYVDRYLDHISISLDNGLWKGRFWLPNEQRIELRRQLPELDIPAGSVIRGTMRIGNYRFNEPIPLSVFAGAPVSVAPKAEREAFAFDEPLDAELREEGLGARAELADVRRQARELIAARALNRRAGLRPGIGAASDVFRYNRAEGAVLSLGLSAVPRPGLTTRFEGGWAFGAAHPLATATVTSERGPLRHGISAYANQPRDVGIAPAASGVVNTLGALLLGTDYLDPYYASGGALEGRYALSDRWALGARLGAERQRSAAKEVDFSIFGEDTGFRAVAPIDEGLMLGGALALSRSAPPEAARGWSAELRAGAGTLTDRRLDGSNAVLRFVRPELRLGGHVRGTRGTELELAGAAGAAFGTLPRQSLYLMGGRGTLPGYDFRAFGGDRYLLGSAVASADLAPPYLRARLLGAAGSTGVGGAGERALDAWGARPTHGIRTSVGAGFGIFHDIVHLDVVRGLGAGGRWEVIFEARRAFWDFL